MQGLRYFAQIGSKVGQVGERSRGRMRIILSSSGFVRVDKSGSLHAGSAEDGGSDFVLPPPEDEPGRASPPKD
jgi:hypothetical protein